MAGETQDSEAEAPNRRLQAAAECLPRMAEDARYAEERARRGWRKARGVTAKNPHT